MQKRIDLGDCPVLSVKHAGRTVAQRVHHPPGILNPIHADPSGALGVEVVDREINNLMSSGAID
jgi:hypothetical protein